MGDGGGVGVVQVWGEREVRVREGQTKRTGELLMKKGWEGGRQQTQAEGVLFHITSPCSPLSDAEAWVVSFLHVYSSLTTLSSSHPSTDFSSFENHTSSANRPMNTHSPSPLLSEITVNVCVDVESYAKKRAGRGGRRTGLERIVVQGEVFWRKLDTLMS